MHDYPNSPEYLEVKPWIRFWARLLDYFLFITASAFVYSQLTGNPIIPGNSLWLNIAAMAAWVPAEALFLCIIGTTPGKWLLNIKVLDESGKKPGFAGALKRSLLVWLCGCYAGTPVISVIGLVNSYLHLSKKRKTFWDEKASCKVDHNYHQPLKLIAAFSLIAVIGISKYISPNMDTYIPDDKTVLSRMIDLYGSEELKQANKMNLDALDLIGQERYQEAEKLLLDALELDPQNTVKNSIYNNLCIVYIHTGDFINALSYIESALDTFPNKSVEYANYGNVLYNLGCTQQAKDAYLTSADFPYEDPTCHFGLGLIYYDDYDYRSAKAEFKKYAKTEDKDPDGWIYLGLSTLYSDGDTADVKKYLDKAERLAPDYAFTIEARALHYQYTGDEDKAEEILSNALSKNPEDYDLLCKTAEYYYYNEEADEALKYAELAISIDAEKYDAYKVKADTLFYKEEKTEAIKAVETMTGKNPDDPVVYNIAGDILYDAYELKLSEQYYKKVLQTNPMNLNARLRIMGSLSYRKRYSECLSFALGSINMFENNIDIPWYIADAYSRLNDPDKAIRYYERALELDPDNQSILLSIAWESYQSGDFTKAGEYADRLLKADSSNYSARDLKNSLEKKQECISVQVADFIETNYMYFRQNDSFKNIRERLKAKGNAVTNDDILELFAAAYKQDDMFSFVLYDEYYMQFRDLLEEKTVESEVLDQDIIYVRISSFTPNTANEFLEVIDYIDSPENKYLVIDLRNNGGGDTNSGCNILDFLLADCVVCNLIYKDGYSSQYYSDDEYIAFKHIFVLTDGNTASCAELVTLGLKTYLDNVTVIGSKTFGKGVGQLSFEDKERNLAVFVVNHYWNVREINIKDRGIEPDIPLKGKDDGEYMDEVIKLITGLDG